MANTTVYPFGTDGILPSSVGIIDDLSTGGADKALSAEQGKVIGQMLGVTDVEIPDVSVDSFTANTLKTAAVDIVYGRTYKISWTGATPNSSVLSVSFGTTSATSQTTPLNITTLTSESGYVLVVAEVNATHLRIVSRDPVVTTVSLSHIITSTGVLDHLEDSMRNAFPMLNLAWVDHSAMNSTFGVVASNTNCICSRTFLPTSLFSKGKVIRFLAQTRNKYNFAIAFYTDATEASFLGRTSFSPDTEIDYETLYASAGYFRISLVYKDPTNTDVISEGVADEFELWNLSLIWDSSLQEVAAVANSSLRLPSVRSEIRRDKVTTSIYAGQGFCKCGDYWLSGRSSGASFDSGSPQNSVFYIYNSSFAEVGRITHNLGHVSCLSYDEETDCLISSNGNANEYPRLDILLDATAHITAAINSQTSQYMYGASDVIHIPLHTSTKDLLANGDAGVWCFGGNNRYVYISVRDSVTRVRKFYRGLLGVGDADFSSDGWGTFISGKDDTEYNGTLKIIEQYDGENITSAQGFDYMNGKLILSCSTTSIDINVLNLSSAKYQIEGMYRISNLAADGSLISAEPEDLTVNEDGVFLNTTIGTFKLHL